MEKNNNRAEAVKLCIFNFVIMAVFNPIEYKMQNINGFGTMKCKKSKFS